MGKKLLVGTRSVNVQNKFLISQFNAIVFNSKFSESGKNTLIVLEENLVGFAQKQQSPQG